MGVCEETGDDATVLGRKLCFSLFVWLLMFLYLLPEAGGTPTFRPGWLGSAAIRPALFEPGCFILRCGIGLCVVFTTPAKYFLSDAVQLLYHIVALRQTILYVVAV